MTITSHLRIPLGMFPEKAGSTGIIPKDLIRSRILNCEKKEKGAVSLLENNQRNLLQELTAKVSCSF